MWRWCFMGLLLCLTCHATAKSVYPGPDAGTDDAAELTAQVVNGTQAVLNQYPWTVSLGQRGTGVEGRFCGGSLIASRWVLTAAHCVDDANLRVEPLDVILGRQDLNDNEQGERIDVIRVVVHPNYVASEFINDIAVLELATASRQPTITLAENGTIVAAGTQATVSGWGVLSPHLCFCHFFITCQWSHRFTQRY